MAKPVAQSVPKTELWEALGLTPGDQAHEKLYLKIKAECAIGYDEICRDRRNLLPEFTHIPNRFQYNQMRPESIDNAIVQIYRNAAPEVRQWYSIWGVDGTRNNFVIRWFLWHLFRYRDGRNERRARSSEFHADDDESMLPVPSTAEAGSSSGRYDPVRDVYRNA